MSVSDRTLPLPDSTVEPRALPQVVMTLVRALAFWATIVLPFTYVPLLAAGPESPSMVLAFVCLVAVNVCAIVVGQPYGRAE